MNYGAALFLVITGFLFSRTAYATSTLSFAGDDCEVQIVVSDTKDEIVGFRVYEGDNLLRAAEPGELAASRYHYDPKRQTIDLVLSARGKAPKIVLNVRGESAIITIGSKRLQLRGDWLK